MAADHDIEWCVQMRHQVVAHLDAAASACVVELSAMDPVSQDHAWLSSPHVRLSEADFSGPGLVRVLRAAPALQLASLEAGSADAAALGVLTRLSMTHLTHLCLSDCPALVLPVELKAWQPQLRSLALSSCDGLTSLWAAHVCI